MTNKNNKLTIISKIILAFTIFSSFLFIVNKFFKEKIPSKEQVTLNSSQNESFFYHTIGKYNAPSLKNNSPKLKSRYTLEFDIKDSQERALKKIDELASKGITAYYTPLNNNGKVIYRIRKGFFLDKAEAQTIAEKLEFSQQVKTKIIKL